VQSKFALLWHELTYFTIPNTYAARVDAANTDLSPKNVAVASYSQLYKTSNWVEWALLFCGNCVTSGGLFGTRAGAFLLNLGCSNFFFNQAHFWLTRAATPATLLGLTEKPEDAVPTYTHYVTGTRSAISAYTLAAPTSGRTDACAYAVRALCGLELQIALELYRLCVKVYSV
jgi:hypothetical protein